MEKVTIKHSGIYVTQKVYPVDHSIISKDMEKMAAKCSCGHSHPIEENGEIIYEEFPCKDCGRTHELKWRGGSYSGEGELVRSYPTNCPY